MVGFVFIRPPLTCFLLCSFVPCFRPPSYSASNHDSIWFFNTEEISYGEIFADRRYMYRCNHCNQLGISYIQKWWSFVSLPAKCVRCKKLSYVPATVSNGIFCSSIFFVALTIVFATTFNSWLIVGNGLIGSILFYGTMWHVVGMRTTTIKQVHSARKFEFGIFCLAVLLKFLS